MKTIPITIRQIKASVKQIIEMAAIGGKYYTKEQEKEMLQGFIDIQLDLYDI